MFATVLLAVFLVQPAPAAEPSPVPVPSPPTASGAAPRPVLPPAKSDPKPLMKARSHSVVGQVTAVAEGRLTVRTTAGASESWVIPADVKIVKGGRVAGLADLVVGTPLLLICEDGDSGEHRVRGVRILASLPAPAPAR